MKRKKGSKKRILPPRIVQAPRVQTVRQYVRANLRRLVREGKVRQ